MKLLTALLSVLLIVGCTNDSLHQNTMITWKSGIFESFECSNSGKYSGHQAELQVCKESKLVNEDSEFPIKTGMSFGLEYLIVPEKSEKCFEETRSLVHPPMHQPDGSITTHYSRSYKVGDCPEAVPTGRDIFTWFIEHEWEAVKGEWDFKVLINGKPVISKTFTTY